MAVLRVVNTVPTDRADHWQKGISKNHLPIAFKRTVFVGLHEIVPADLGPQVESHPRSSHLSPPYPLNGTHDSPSPGVPCGLQRRVHWFAIFPLEFVQRKMGMAVDAHRS